MGKKMGTTGSKAGASALLKAAESVLLGGVLHAARFEDAEDFKHSLIDALHLSRPFTKAALDLHGPLRQAARQRGRTGQDSEVARAPRFGGRVQASHHDPSAIEKDRGRGYRLKGGKRVGQALASRGTGRNSERGAR